MVIYRVYKRVAMSVKFMVANALREPETVRSRAVLPRAFCDFALSCTLSLCTAALGSLAEDVINGSRYLSCQTNSILCREPNTGESFETVPLVELDYNGNDRFLFLSLALRSFLLCNFDYYSYNRGLCEGSRCGRFEMHLHLIRKDIPLRSSFFFLFCF